ncbi:hypothetical protein JH06_1252 [Blastocystis sp. subtype 4]|uniref:hypothetical protein n=1 Tax=Blastocystis sp. subtype 4 TaxID=944170 RepID=UPI000711CCBB|nr:hypothetical protein JH06_1252 [Blastocystis sp. subtype 4]KNB45214.1 hypothetical protein JH06_1252 [Blastocystis sp. subtype 4]|eukprot:XP_014528657.1 hypothetical protein JH06_1252 [Blastocystis sp. subtype 4]
MVFFILSTCNSDCNFLDLIADSESTNCNYNEFAKQWINTGISVISSTQFNITSSSLSQKFKPITQVDGFYYPFRDKCNEKGDPECLITPAFFYDSSIVVDKFYPTHSVVTDGGQFVLNDTFVFSRVLVFSPLDLHCNTVRPLCEEKCIDMEGQWNETTERCSIQQYLNSVCYRLLLNETWIPDYTNSAKLKDNVQQAIGCEYSNQWSPYQYSTKKTGFIRVSLRYYIDSFIIASSATKGCSDRSYESNHCFGKPASETRHGPFVLLVFAACSLLLEIGVLVFCIKGNQSSNHPVDPLLEEI